MINLIKNLFKKNWKFNPNRVLAQFLKLSSKHRIILSIMSRNKFLFQVERLINSEGWQGIAREGLLGFDNEGENVFVIYHIYNAVGFEDRFLNYVSLQEFSRIDECLDNRDVETYYTFITANNVDTLSKELDKSIISCYQEEIYNYPFELIQSEV